MHHIGISYIISPSDPIPHLLWSMPCDEILYSVEDYNLTNYNRAIGKMLHTNPEEKVPFGKGEKPDILIPKWYPFLRSVDCPKCDTYLQMELLSNTEL